MDGHKNQLDMMTEIYIKLNSAVQIGDKHTGSLKQLTERIASIAERLTLIENAPRQAVTV
jgi:hypothetical protein